MVSLAVRSPLRARLHSVLDLAPPSRRLRILCCHPPHLLLLLLLHLHLHLTLLLHLNLLLHLHLLLHLLLLLDLLRVYCC